MSVVIYGKEGCPYTTAALKDFDARGVTYNYHDVLADRQALEVMLEKSDGQRKVPVIVEDGRVTVGFNGT